MTEPAFRYAVLRAGPGLPPGFLPPEMEGRWYDLKDIPQSWAPQESGAVAVATDRFERREDGATAQTRSSKTLAHDETAPARPGEGQAGA